MQRDAAWMSMSDGSTGTTMALASRTICGICSAGTAAGVSTMSLSVPCGTRNANERVTPVCRSHAAIG